MTNDNAATKFLVQDLDLYYGKFQALKKINLDIKEKEITALIGPSGCGKTTLLRILMGLETPDSGTVQGVGNIGAVFQESRLCPQLTAVGNICLVGGVNPAQAQAELQTLGFTQAELALPVARLSGGQKRRTALLRALWAPSDTLLLDEPFTGMDPDTLAAAAALLSTRCGTEPVLLATHDREAIRLLGWPVIELEAL